tara:strand:+ start:179 stop:562 length:384 start_codon:yes stop_codon:yes gene_type:complete
MTDVNQKMLDALMESSRALIVSNELVSASVRANSETVKTTNETVKELAVSVRELVTTERERVVKDKQQKEVNTKQEIYNIGNNAKWNDAHDTIVRSKRFHSVWDSAFSKVVGALAIGLMVLLGFNFK